MTTETELRDLLTGAAAGPSSPPAWDEVVRRGRARATRTRTTVALVTAAAVTALAVGTYTVLDTGNDSGLDVTEDPAGPAAPAPTTSEPTPTSGSRAATAVAEIAGARAGDRPEVTVLLPGSDPTTGYDACQEIGPALEDGSPVRITLVDAEAATDAWLTCHTSPFATWASVALDKPVHTRQLVDGATGMTVPVVDEGKLLVPPTVPAPFSADQRDEFTGVATPNDRAIQTYTLSWSAGDLVLHVSWWAEAVEPPDCEVGRPVEVRGTRGYLCGGNTGGVLSWIETGSYRVVSYSDVGGNAITLPVDLVAFADSLVTFRAG